MLNVHVMSVILLFYSCQTADCDSHGPGLDWALACPVQQSVLLQCWEWRVCLGEACSSSSQENTSSITRQEPQHQQTSNEGQTLAYSTW